MPTEVVRNEPKLADVRLPWNEDEPPNALQLLGFFPATLRYLARHGTYFAPARLDTWRYRRLLARLDRACVATLENHGALSPRELSECLNRGTAQRTNPHRTGIHGLTPATTRDWLLLASRRGLVAPVDTEAAANGARRALPRTGRWQLTARGRERPESRVTTLISRLPLTAMLSGLASLIFGGTLVAIVKYLEIHRVLLLAAIYVLAAAVYVGFLRWYLARAERRQGAGRATVAIETVRAAGRPIPSLDP